MLHEVKYKGSHLILKEVLSYPSQYRERNVGRLINLFKPEIISVPLHPQRFNERGFNQSDMVADLLLMARNIKRRELLIRTINTKHLANISEKRERKKCIRGAFTYVGKTVPDTVLIVDDVVTTGSTLLECASTLKKIGVRVVLAVSLAKG